jgi:hypothetical protein
MNNRSLIEVKAVSKTYRRGQLSVPALLNISFEIGLGELVILTGSSGAGKTTLLNLLAALDWPDQGEIIVDGKNIGHLSLWSAASYRRVQVGIIFQAYNLLPQLTAIQNVALPMIAEIWICAEPTNCCGLLAWAIELCTAPPNSVEGNNSVSPLLALWPIIQNLCSRMSQPEIWMKRMHGKWYTCWRTLVESEGQR